MMSSNTFKLLSRPLGRDLLMKHKKPCASTSSKPCFSSVYLASSTGMSQRYEAQHFGSHPFGRLLPLDATLRRRGHVEKLAAWQYRPKNLQTCQQTKRRAHEVPFF